MSDLEFISVGLNHHTAPVELREKLSVKASCLPAILDQLRENRGLREAVVLSTCNRFEVYGVAEPGSDSAETILTTAFRRNRTSLPVPGELDPFLHCCKGEAVIRHLFRVASSLDSLVVGETEIVGQVKTAYLAAKTAGATGKYLNQLFQKALSVSKKVRRHSGIGRWTTSVGSVSVELAAKIFGEDLRDRTILIIGAGKISETTLRHLSKRGARSILVSNRSYDRARELARQFNGQACHFIEIPKLLQQADIVISSTSAPGFILGKPHFDQVMSCRGGRPLFLIDLAVPRDIDPVVQELDGVYLYNVDQLGNLARENRALRKAEAAASEQMIAAEAQQFAQRLFPAPKPVLPSRPNRWPDVTLPNWAEAI